MIFANIFNEEYVWYSFSLVTCHLNFPRPENAKGYYTGTEMSGPLITYYFNLSCLLDKAKRYYTGNKFFAA